MAAVADQRGHIASRPHAAGHALWVRICHWLVALGFLTLAVTGFVILMAHPRLYWGDAGNDLMPALLELPISPNYRPDGWQQTVSFTELAHAPVSANRTYGPFNQNGWGRSLHFLAGWLFVIAGAFYAAAGLVTGHIRRDLLPRARELAPRVLWQEVKRRLRLERGQKGGGAPYGVLQRCTYVSVAFILLPLMMLTGLTMSPTVTAAYPMLLDVFGGHQSARTLHFFGFAALVVFLIVHVAMVLLTGFRRQLRAMTLGSRP